ncbi:MAG: DNA mismatch repair protein MutS [Thermoanaerobaculia bacterium]
MPESGQLTPMLRHYLEVKAEHPDAVLLYRMGDFYEMFFEDAVAAAPILEVTLTARNKGSENEAPMCGVPHHALGAYLAKLVRAGLKVAICDQMEDPAEAKGLVRREVTRVVTPGTLSDPSLLSGKEDNYLAALVWDADDAAGGAFLDVSTGSFLLRRWSGAEEALEDLKLLRPREVLADLETLPANVRGWVESEVVCRTALADDRWTDPRRSARVLADQLRAATVKGWDLEPKEPAVRAAAAALGYARETQQSDLSHLRDVQVGRATDDLALDATTLGNLEVFRNARDGGRRGSLLGVLDLTCSPPGGRMVARWLRRPLRDPEAVDERLGAVERLLGDEPRRERLRDELRSLGDPERLRTRAVLGSLTPREAAALRDGLRTVPRVLAELEGSPSGLLRRLAEVDPLAALCGELERVLVESPPASSKDGGIVREGVSGELDEARSLARDGKRHILALEAREREATGIGSLKVRFNKVFGYYLEVTKANLESVPERYVRKQTLVNAERFITPELKELEERILGAEERQGALEAELFGALVACVAAESEGLGHLTEALATLDVLAAFAEAAARFGYVRPEVGAAGGPLTIEEGRHPVVERLGGDAFVPNDVELDGDSAQIVILTGPNMGGKSTYLRQVALIVLMAQAGSFVPARSARVGVCDRIFTRVGASDDLSRGESTFMVEMIETARILHQATAESLVVLDEVGRGTATFDGLSLAWAIVERLHEVGRPKTLFATHYHELTELAALLPRVVNRTLAVKEWEDQIVFLRRVVPGSADKSYGVHVARLAGIPRPVVERAQEILANLESQEYDLHGKPRLARGGGPASEEQDQLRLFAPPEDVVASILREVDLDRLSPLAALNLLQSLKSRLKD